MSKQYVPPANYDDMEGNVKQFTYVDHDIKTKVSNHISGNIDDVRNAIKKYREDKIEEVLAMPAVSIGDMEQYQVLINRSAEGITWNKNAVKELLLTTDHVYFLPILVWKKTVKESHWHDNVEHEDILKGKWKNLM